MRHELTVACPQCGAATGDNCKGHDGMSRRWAVHRERQKLRQLHDQAIALANQLKGVRKQIRSMEAGLT